jgi:predicted transcriptional regulator
VIKIDAVAKLTNRSRTYVIEHFIRSQINDKNDDLNVDFQVIKAAQGISLN